GQEYDEENPFQFFTNYGDPTLQKAVTEGRRSEFKDFDFQNVPDPQDRTTFERSRLNWAAAEGENPKLKWYASLLELRNKHVTNAPRTCRAELVDGIIRMQIPAEDSRLKAFARIRGQAPLPDLDGWKKVLCEEAEQYAVTVWEKG
ncbi:MAG TPA: hypothetical protein VE783_06985, partial [Candidatus Limnocylindrales bacterium]|nr:hypothetical protein [Candidatus Limnocylindrales bacterium]